MSTTYRGRLDVVAVCLRLMSMFNHYAQRPGFLSRRLDALSRDADDARPALPDGPLTLFTWPCPFRSVHWA